MNNKTCIIYCGPFGMAGTESRRKIGPRPEAGLWR